MRCGARTFARSPHGRRRQCRRCRRRAHWLSNDYFSIFICSSRSLFCLLLNVFFYSSLLLPLLLPFYFQFHSPFRRVFNWLNDFSARNLISSIWIPSIFFFFPSSLWKPNGVQSNECVWVREILYCFIASLVAGCWLCCECGCASVNSFLLLHKNFINSIIKRIALTATTNKI